MATKLMEIPMPEKRKLSARKLGELLEQVAAIYSGEYSYTYPTVRLTSKALVVEVADGYQ